ALRAGGPVGREPDARGGTGHHAQRGPGPPGRDPLPAGTGRGPRARGHSCSPRGEDTGGGRRGRRRVTVANRSTPEIATGASPDRRGARPRAGNPRPDPRFEIRPGPSAPT